MIIGSSGNSRPRIAIVHDDLARSGGAERVAMYMGETFPAAPIYTSVYFPDQTYPEFRSKVVIPLPGAGLIHDERRFKQLFLFWILGFRMLDLRDYDLVLSSTTFGAKHVCPSNPEKHVSYCYAPFRLLWKPQSYSQESLPINRQLSGLQNLLLPSLRRMDFAATQKIQRIATSCQNSAEEIQLRYDRDAEIINPPVRLSDFSIGEGKGDYYLSVGRLISHKRVDLAVKACTKLDVPLVVVGEGPEKAELKKIAGQNVDFVGLAPDKKLRELYSGCKALLFPSHEDYGIVPIEAQASGRPVIAYGKGGVLETVVEGQTGLFFYEQSEEALIEAILKFEQMWLDPVAIRETVQRFDIGQFKRKLRQFVLDRS